MKNAAVVGLDLAKQVFQAHGIDQEGATLFSRKIRRADLMGFFSKLPPCVVAMEACGSSHYWAREISALGHDVRILPAQHVKPFVSRGKTDAADAEAITLAFKRPNIRFVPVKTAEQQAAAMVFRTRTLFVRQRANAINALRGHMAEFGLIADKGTTNVGKLASAIPDASDGTFPAAARFILTEILAQINALTSLIERLEKEVKEQARKDDDIRRLTTIPGIGILTAATIRAYVPDATGFKSGRQFAAWLGLTPRANSSGGHARPGRISRKGNPELRSLLYIGAASVLISARRFGRASPWLRKLLERRPFKVAAIAVANKTARVIWALLTKEQDYCGPIEPKVA
jgi:transposase